MTTNRDIGAGGFLLPRIYTQKQNKVIDALKQGDIDFIGDTKWSFLDHFLAFTLRNKFFDMAEKSYPNPRLKTEIPVWFLLSCQLILRLQGKAKYSQMKTFLHSGPIISRLGFNVGAEEISFNKKNKFKRDSPIHHDSVRKFFKDTSSDNLRKWYLEHIQPWFKAKKTFDSKGLFILDQTHLVVPDNHNYKNAVKMPVDHFGQLYWNYSKMSNEQKKVIKRHPCYTLSCLLHLTLKKDFFHIASYDWDPGNEDELVQEERIIPSFYKRFPGMIKELIVDRGYISGDIIGRYKKDYNIDTLVPLKSNMDNYKDAIDIAHRKNSWETLSEVHSANNIMTYKLQGSTVLDVDLWNSNSQKQNVYIGKETIWNNSKQEYIIKEWAISSSKKYASTKEAIDRYKIRFQIEERYRQFKYGWNLNKFCSPNENLMESHICFTLLTYSLLQLYLRQQDLENKTNQFIQSLKDEKEFGKSTVAIYAGNNFATMSFDKFLVTTLGLSDSSREKISQMAQNQLARQEGAKKSL